MTEDEPGELAVAADLIERTLAEEALRESEERLRLIANTAPVMIWMASAEKQITYLNQIWLDYTGWPVDAALGQRRLDVLHPNEAERCRDVYEKALPREVSLCLYRVLHQIKTGNAIQECRRRPPRWARR